MRCFLYVVRTRHTKREHRKRLLLPAGAAAAGILAGIGSGLYAARRSSPLREVHDICLSVCGETAWLRGLMDTGNCLYDGPDRQPVCVMDQSVIKRQLPLLSEKVADYLREGEMDEKLRLHYLSYSSLGRPDGLALAFTADYLLVQKNRSKRKTMHPRIAVADSSPLFGRAYQIILNPDVLRKREE